MGSVSADPRFARMWNAAGRNAESRLNRVTLPLPRAKWVCRRSKGMEQFQQWV